MPGIQIIGVGGLLGKNLFKYFSEQGFPTFGTSHQKFLADSPRISFLDLLSPDFGFFREKSLSLKFSIICSGETAIDKCKTEIDRSEALNVTHTIQLIENLWENKITPIFVSSDMVFDGKIGSYREDDICDPMTQYGKQKRSVEDFLISSSKPWLIVRLCKIFDIIYQDHTLITGWMDKLQAGKSIKCADDQFIAPTFVTDICKAIEGLIIAGKTGIFHVSSPEIYSRFELGVKVAQYFQIDQKAIEKCSIFDFNFIEPRSCHNTLNAKKLMDEISFNFSTLESSLEKISNNYKQCKT
jgi:dTDP-4-dehydrorhamnose reductase